MCQPIRGWGRHLGSQINPKYINSVKDITFLLLETFRQMPFSCLREGIENVSTNLKLRRRSWFSDQPKKHKLGRGCWVLASRHVSSNSIHRFQIRSRKCLSQLEAGRPSWFKDKLENTNVVKDLEFLVPVKFRRITFSYIRGKVIMPQPISDRDGHLGVWSARKTQTW